MTSTPDVAQVLPVLRVIVGPTAAGKSALALHLAQNVGASVVSADSRQVYRGFDIGTAKPTADDLARVPHFGVNVALPTERFSASQWADGTRHWLQQIAGSGRSPLIVGGTGFYIRALVEPLVSLPPLDVSRRDRLANELASLTTDELRRWCTALDPARSSLGRTQLRRAIETALLSGQRLSDLHRTAGRAPRAAARYLLLDPGAALGARIVGRVEAMLDAGWLTEVTRLAEALPPDAPAWSATGYDVLRAVAAGELSLDEAVGRIIVATRQYAKRQRTWFRHQLAAEAVTRLDPTQAGAQEIALAWWHGENV